MRSASHFTVINTKGANLRYASSGKKGLLFLKQSLFRTGKAISGLIKRTSELAEAVHKLQLRGDKVLQNSRQMKGTIESVGDDHRYIRLALQELMLENQVTNVRIQVWMQQMLKMSGTVLGRNNLPPLQLDLPDYGKHMKSQGQFLRVSSDGDKLVPRLAHAPEHAVQELQEILKKYRIERQFLNTRMDFPSELGTSLTSTNIEENNKISFSEMLPYASVALRRLYSRAYAADAALVAHDAAILRRLRGVDGANAESKRSVHKSSLKARNRALKRREALHTFLKSIIETQAGLKPDTDKEENILETGIFQNERRLANIILGGCVIEAGEAAGKILVDKEVFEKLKERLEALEIRLTSHQGTLEKKSGVISPKQNSLNATCCHKDNKIILRGIPASVSVSDLHALLHFRCRLDSADILIPLSSSDSIGVPLPPYSILPLDCTSFSDGFTRDYLCRFVSERDSKVFVQRYNGITIGGKESLPHSDSCMKYGKHTIANILESNDELGDFSKGIRDIQSFTLNCEY